MNPSSEIVIPSRALMFQCRVSALRFVPFVMAVPSPSRDLRTWLRIGVAWLCSYCRPAVSPCNRFTFFNMCRNVQSPLDLR